MRNFRNLLLITIFLFLTATVFSQSKKDKNDPYIGEWFTNEKKNNIVEIYKVDDKYFGEIVWLANPYDSRGRQKLDRKNNDRDKNRNPLIGTLVLDSFEKDRDNKLKGGKIYSPYRGKTFNGTVVLNGKELNINTKIAFVNITKTWIRKK